LVKKGRPMATGRKVLKSTHFKWQRTINCKYIPALKRDRNEELLQERERERERLRERDTRQKNSRRQTSFCKRSHIFRPPHTRMSCCTLSFLFPKRQRNYMVAATQPKKVPHICCCTIQHPLIWVCVSRASVHFCVLCQREKESLTFLTPEAIYFI
jgi:hypothetical protein